MSNWLAGAAEVTITPPLGVRLTGFAGRTSGATGIHDDLHARVLALEADGTRAALVTLDLLGLDADLVECIRARVAETCAIPAERLLLNCSHTHSGPASISLRGLGERDSAYLDVLTRTVAGAVRVACDRLEPAALRFGTAPVRVGINRREKLATGQMILGRNPEGPLDPRVYALRVDSAAGRPLAILFSHAAHPVVLAGDNLWITADYPGVAAAVLRQIEAGRGAPPVALFAQGCCGNINSDPVGADFEAARRLGTVLGAAAAIAAETAAPLEEVGLQAATRVLSLPFLPPPSVEEAAAAVAAQRERLKQQQAAGAPTALQQAMLEWAEDTLRAAREPERFPGQPFTVQVLVVGEVAFVALSGEVFIELALDIQARSPFARTVVLGYSNGCSGYVPTADAYPDGGYEVTDAYRYYGTLMIAPESERLITNAAVSLLADLAG